MPSFEDQSLTITLFTNLGVYFRLTQSPASHKINSEAERVASLLESYLGTAVQVQCKGRRGEEKKEGENKICQTQHPLKAHTKKGISIYEDRKLGFL